MISTRLRRDTTYVPGFYKIFDEILVNAADNKVGSKLVDSRVRTYIRY